LAIRLAKITQAFMNEQRTAGMKLVKEMGPSFSKSVIEERLAAKGGVQTGVRNHRRRSKE